jgi:hypothetical protein
MVSEDGKEEEEGEECLEGPVTLHERERERGAVAAAFEERETRRFIGDGNETSTSHCS